MLHIYQKHALIIIIMAWEFLKKIKDKSCNAKNSSSGEMAKSLFETYKICRATPKSNVSDSIWHSYGNNVWISIINICITTFEMCFAFLCAISMDWSSKYIIISSQLKCYAQHIFSCISTHCTVYCAWVYLRHIKSAVPHKKHIFQTASGIAMAAMWEYPSSIYALPHLKCVLRCCAKYP